jgi:hypothetical protein
MKSHSSHLLAKEGRAAGPTVWMSLLAGTSVVGSALSVDLDVQPKIDLSFSFCSSGCMLLLPLA